MKKLLILLFLPTLALSQKAPDGYWQRDDDKSVYQFERDRAIIFECGHLLEQQKYTKGDAILTDFFVFDDDLYGFERVHDRNGYLSKFVKVQLALDAGNNRLTLVYPDYREIRLSRFYPMSSPVAQQQQVVMPVQAPAGLPGYWQRDDDQSVYLFFDNTAVVTQAGSQLKNYGFTEGIEKIKNISPTSSGQYAAEDRIYNKETKKMEWESVLLKISANQLTLNYIAYPDRFVGFKRYNEPRELAEIPSHSFTSQSTTSSTQIQKNTQRVYFPKLPVAKQENKSAIGIVIGNKDYRNITDVDFAENDADAMTDLFRNTFGIREGNIITKKNVYKSEFEALFGSSDRSQGMIHNLSRPESDVYIYYSGHGSVDNNGKTYLIPVELEKNSLEIQGYSIDLMYENLSKLNVRSITVIIDACFTGEVAYENVSPIQFRITDPVLKNHNMVVLCATSKNQYASWDIKSLQGVFTQTILECFENYQSTDVDRDRKITVNELYQKVSDFYDGVPYRARLQSNTQIPTLKGHNEEHVLFEY